MKRKKFNQAHAGRLHKGEILLAAAKLVDTRLVEGRLAAFIDAQRLYVDAQRAVDESFDKEREVIAAATGAEANVEIALERLIVALQIDGHPRTSPFSAYGGFTLSALRATNRSEKPAAVRDLVAAILRDPRLSAGLREAAEGVLPAVAALEEALRQITADEVRAREVRNTRDATADRWEEAFNSLKRGARAAADDGAPGLYTALFGRLTPVRNRKTKSAETPDQPPSETPSKAA